MTVIEPILCPDCGHDIDQHSPESTCLGCQARKASNDWGCLESPSGIARAYGEERFHKGWDACELRWAVRCSE